MALVGLEHMKLWKAKDAFFFYSTDPVTKEILSHASITVIFAPTFSKLSIDEWVEEAQEIYSEGMQNMFRDNSQDIRYGHIV